MTRFTLGLTNKPTYRLLSFLLFMLITFHSIAENNPTAAKSSGSIKGTIIARSGNQAIEFANLVLYSSGDSTLVTGTISKPDGSFELKEIPFGSYYLLVHFIGFETEKINDIILTSSNRIFDSGQILLKETHENLQEVEVFQEKNTVQYLIDKKVVNVSKKLDAASGTVANALENTPSVQVDMEGNVMLRGSSNFTVLIDGKPSVLAGSDALKQIPASVVENVEIITNPSAKYDPEGTAGIINIIMKKDAKNSSNGIINLSGGTFRNYSGDFSFNHFSKKINYFISGNYAQYANFPTSDLSGSRFFNDTTYTISQQINRKRISDPYAIEAGIDWYPNESNSFTAAYSYGHWGMLLNMDGNAWESNAQSMETSYSTSNSEMDIDGMYHSASLSHELKLDTLGQKLLSNISFTNWDGYNSTDVDERFTDSNYTNPFAVNHFILSKYNLDQQFHIKIDYTKVFKENATLEAGFQGEYQNLKADYLEKFQDYETQTWFTPQNGSKSMQLLQKIQAGYLTYSGIIKGVDFLAGLRLEYFDRRIEVPEDGMKYPLYQLNLFPTLHLTRQFEQGRQAQFSYSKRVNRPHEWSLNPFPIYSDSYVKQIGNPALRPEFTDSYELNIMQRMKSGFLSLEGFYRQTKDAYTRTLVMDSTGIILIGTENMDKNYAYGAEFTCNLTLKKWWMLFSSINLYNYTVQDDSGSNLLKTNTINSDFSLNNTFRLKNNFRIQLTGFYNAPKQTTQGYQYQVYGANLSLSKDFYKQKLNLTLSMRDIFHTIEYGFTTDTESISSKFLYINEYPIITLRLSYKINDYKHREKESGGDEFQGGGIM
jgi:outer membrane receptor protein involved in Fe transport